MASDDTCRHQRFQGLLEISVPPKLFHVNTAYPLFSLTAISQHFCDSFKGIVIQNVRYFTIRGGSLKLKRLRLLRLLLILFRLFSI